MTNAALKADILVRKRIKPRMAPIPMDTIRVTRSTMTSFDTIDEGRIVDIWDGSMNDTCLLSSDWVGETPLYIIKKNVLHGYDCH